MGCSECADASMFTGNLPGSGSVTCGSGSGKVKVMNEPGVSIGSRAGLVWTPKTLMPMYDPSGSFADGSTAMITEIDTMSLLRTPEPFKHFFAAAQAHRAFGIGRRSWSYVFD
jgi:hypothetical protein